jgi:cytochrome c
VAKRKRKQRQEGSTRAEPSGRGATLQWLVVAAVGIGVLAITIILSGDDTVEVTVPGLSAEARQGQALFTKTCTECHGENASGSDRGPPLIHDTYNPGHHDDRAFYRAASHGVRQHHWPYGDMPPQPGISRNEMAKIIRFVRETQAANGIVYKPHRM